MGKTRLSLVAVLKQRICPTSTLIDSKLTSELIVGVYEVDAGSIRSNPLASPKLPMVDLSRPDRD